MSDDLNDILDSALSELDLGGEDAAPAAAPATAPVVTAAAAPVVYGPPRPPPANAAATPAASASVPAGMPEELAAALRSGHLDEATLAAAAAKDPQNFFKALIQVVGQLDTANAEEGDLDIAAAMQSLAGLNASAGAPSGRETEAAFERFQQAAGDPELLQRVLAAAAPGEEGDASSLAAAAAAAAVGTSGGEPPKEEDIAEALASLRELSTNPELMRRVLAGDMNALAAGAAAAAASSASASAGGATPSADASASAGAASYDALLDSVLADMQRSAAPVSVAASADPLSAALEAMQQGGATGGAPTAGAPAGTAAAAAAAATAAGGPSAASLLGGLGGADDAKLMEFMQQLESLGDNPSESQLDALVDGMMKNMFSREVMYEPLKAVRDLFPPWLAQHGDSLPPADAARYRSQCDYYHRVVAAYDRNAPEEEIMQIMRELHEFGTPPPEIAAQLSPELSAMNNMPGTGAPGGAAGLPPGMPPMPPGFPNLPSDPAQLEKMMQSGECSVM